VAKDKLTEYDATAANNTVVGDVNLAENSSLPSDLNNAVREVMSHLKAFASGTDAIDALTVTGAATVNGAFTSRGIDDNADATAITIDSSENVLVGTTNTDPAFNNVAGQSMAASGQFQVTRDGGIPALINRKSDFGTILDLRKDGTTVGSIGTTGGDLTIDGPSEHTGLRFEATDITPRHNGAASNGVNDLGTSAARFKDLYLSGGVYLGGTGSANHLDSYEEGNWTPAVANGTVTVGNNRYTKIGNIVNLRCQLSSFSDRSSSAAITISGLPFGSGSASSTAGVVLGRYNDAGDGPIVANIGNSASIMNLYGMSDGGNWAAINHSNLNNAAATFLIQPVRVGQSIAKGDKNGTYRRNTRRQD